jgi:hypothetical protein
MVAIDVAFASNRAMNGVAMNTFTIDTHNNITAHAGLPAAADESSSFTNQRDLAKLTADWPISRLVETWNSFAGVTPFADLKPVKRFADRKGAVSRIWKAVERMPPTLRNRRNPSQPPKQRRKGLPSKRSGATPSGPSPAERPRSHTRAARRRKS